MNRHDPLAHYWVPDENGQPKCVYEHPLAQEIHDRMVEHYLAWEKEHVIPDILAKLKATPTEIPE